MPGRHFILTVRVATAVTFLSLALTTAVHAAPLFRAPAMLIDTRGYPTSVAAADLDEDGRLDLVMTSTGYPDMFGKVSVGLGNGDGTFQAWTHFETGSWPLSVAVGDINEDGDLDLVTANADAYGREKGSLSILIGRGDGTFAPRTDLGVGRRERVAMADLDGDGHLDLMTDRSVLPGNGDGTFGAEISVNAWHFALGDFNADGRLDLVSPVGAEPQNELPAVMVRLGNGDGTFGAGTGFGVGAYTAAVAVGDVNRDGRLDIAVADTYERSQTVSVLLGNGDGTFGSERRYPTGMNPASVAIADLDGDGSGDVVTANYGFDPDADSNTATVLLGNGDGTFRITPELYVGVNPVSLTVADLNTDGAPDLVMANDNVPGTITVVLGNRDGTLGTTVLGTPGRPRSLAVGDLDNDGLQDLVVGQDFSTGVSLFLGTGGGAFGPRTESEFGSLQTWVAVADLNGDGRMDIAATDFWTGVAVKLGNGDGTFGPSASYATGRGTRFVSVADVNEDQRPDLVVANNDENTISILLGNGDGTFGAGQTVAAGYSIGRLAVADLNRDGHLDFAASNGALLFGRGNGMFDSGASYGGSGFPAIGDLNADGVPDIAAGSGSAWLGNGDGTFRLGSTFEPGISPSCIVMADFDHDGRLDVAVGNEDVAGAVTVLLGQGDGTFGVRSRFGVGRGAPVLATGDLNADGLTDLASTNFSSRSISPLFGNTKVALKRHAIWRHYSIEVPAPLQFALEGFRPNPSMGAPVVAFTLADDSPAVVEVLDLAGRRVMRQDLGGLGAGRHIVPLAATGPLAPGVYMVRLHQAARTLSARGVVVR